MRDSPFRGPARHRADEIGVHERKWYESAWLPLALLAVLAVVAIAFMTFGRSRMSAPTIGTSTQPQTPLAAAPGMGTACRSSTIYFERDLSVLGRDDYDEIRVLGDCLKQNPSHKVMLEGRADPRETLAGYNTLAQSRADAIADELMSLGVSSGQIITVVSAATCSESDESCFEQDRSVTFTTGP
jgi:outer membrane protein OmpA-like peptidoglycan-associated protein